MHNKKPRRCCFYSIFKQRGIHYARVEPPQLPYQNTEPSPILQQSSNTELIKQGLLEDPHYCGAVEDGRSEHPWGQTDVV